MLRSLKSVPRPHSELRRGLPPALPAAPLPEPGRVPLGPAEGWGKGSAEGLPLLGVPRGEEPAVPDAGRAGPVVSHTVIVRSLMPGQKGDSQYLSGPAGKRPRKWKFPQKLFLKYFGVSAAVCRFS